MIFVTVVLTHPYQKQDAAAHQLLVSARNHCLTRYSLLHVKWSSLAVAHGLWILELITAKLNRTVKAIVSRARRGAEGLLTLFSICDHLE